MRGFDDFLGHGAIDAGQAHVELGAETENVTWEK